MRSPPCAAIVPPSPTSSPVAVASKCSPSAADAPAGSPEHAILGDCHDAAAPHLRHEFRYRVDVTGNGPLDLHRFEGKMQHKRGLHAAGVGVAAPVGRPGAHVVIFAPESRNGLSHSPCIASVRTDEQESSVCQAGRTTEFDEQQLECNLADRQVPGKSSCSPDAPYGSTGAAMTSARAEASPVTRALAMSASVVSGKCGPCCSVEPSGTAST